MQDSPTIKPSNELEPIRVSLVDGDAGVRHARQLMLRSENFDVQSYATCAALLADPGSRDYPCIVLDIEMKDDDGVSVLREMRATGWRGRAILLDGQDPDGSYVREAARHGDSVLERTIGDGALLAAISASVDRSWSGWNPLG